MSIADDFEKVRQVLCSDEQIKSLVGKTKNAVNVFYVARPKDAKCNNYITMNYSELNGGTYARLYELKITAVADNYICTANIKERVIELLDRFTGKYGITGAVNSIRLNNGNSIVYNDEDGKYYSFLYFTVMLK